jgi:hypothetical protein
VHLQCRRDVKGVPYAVLGQRTAEETVGEFIQLIVVKVSQFDHDGASFAGQRTILKVGEDTRKAPLPRSVEWATIIPQWCNSALDRLVNT